MNAKISVCLFTLAFASQIYANDRSSINENYNYCYKPTKPLLFASGKSKQMYADDLQEYQRCKKNFDQMQADISKMKRLSNRRYISSSEKETAGLRQLNRENQYIVHTLMPR